MNLVHKAVYQDEKVYVIQFEESLKSEEDSGNNEINQKKKFLNNSPNTNAFNNNGAGEFEDIGENGIPDNARSRNIDRESLGLDQSLHNSSKDGESSSLLKEEDEEMKQIKDFKNMFQQLRTPRVISFLLLLVFLFFVILIVLKGNFFFENLKKNIFKR